MLSSGKFETIVLLTWMRGIPASRQHAQHDDDREDAHGVARVERADARHQRGRSAVRGPPPHGAPFGFVSGSSWSTAGAKVIAAIAASATPIPP